jgi:hypothetical protein
MYKHNSRFQQSMKFKGRRLSGYPKSRKLAATQSPATGEHQFETGTAYIKQISPMVDQFMQAGLTHANIADQLKRRGISTPSGDAWTESLVAQLVQAVRSHYRKYAKRRRRTKGANPR